MLQMRLDGDIVQLGVQTGALDGVQPQPLDATTSAYVKETLRRAITYLDRFPRTVQADPAFAGSERVIARTLAAARSEKSGGSAP
jgi:hypothetical protein